MPFISWLLENRVMRIMFELNTEELGGEGCIMWSFIICTACEVAGYQRTVTKWVRKVACMGLKVILNRLLIENGRKESIRKACMNLGG